MYAKLSYNADSGNTAEQVLADIKDLLLGETVLANLSNNIDTATSVIDTSFTTVAYTLYDTVGTDRFIFQIPYHDDAAQYFYLELWAYNTTQIHIRLWETWDTGSNTGTNATYYHYLSSIFLQNINYATAPFTIYISATARHLMCRAQYNSGSIWHLGGFFQYDRGEAWDTPAAGKAPVLVTYNGTGFATSAVYTLPHKRSDGNVYTLNSGALYMHTRYGNSFQDDLNLQIGNSSSSARGLNASADPVHNMYEFGFSYTSSGERFLTGRIIDMYLATYQNGGFGDIVSINSNNYIIWEIDGNYRLAVRKG